ncbi:MAG: HAD family hydrolase [Chloroflexota bacterium]|nr:MAG: HAD family hydrolase [Chloroflexota bacterium]
MPKIRAVIFDCYSTLIDIKTNEEKGEVFHNLSLYLQYYGAKMNAESLKSALKLERERYPYPKDERYPEIDLEIVFRNILQKEGLDNPFLIESCCKLFRVLSREQFQLFPDSLPVLEEMRQKGYQLGIVSDAQKVFCLDEGRMLGINPFFSRVIMSTHLGFRKPDPRIFMVACTLLGILPIEAVYIGNDLETDIGGAKGAGMQAILLDRQGRSINQEPKPDFYASSLWDAWEWIKSNS